jgi:hypothetical protein
MPQFDVVVGNPPYKGSLHLNFFKIAYNISKKHIIWIHPSVWLLDEKNNSKEYIETKEMIKDTVEEFTFIDGNDIFKVAFFSPFVIDVINKNKISKGIRVIDKISNKEILYDNIYDINKWSDINIYPVLKNKIMKLASQDNLQNHINKNNGDHYVNLAYIRGHVGYPPINMKLNGDFYTLITKEEKPANKKTKHLFYSFKTPTEANNFISFIKTRFAMFSLSIYKTGAHVYSGRILRSVPWLDFTRSWTYNELYEYFQLTQEEINFIKTNIPKYY